MIVDSLPSGIPNFDIYPGDHILFFTASNKKTDIIIDFVTAGLQNNEVCHFPLGAIPGLSEEKVRNILQHRVGPSEMDKLNLVSASPGQHYKFRWEDEKVSWKKVIDILRAKGESTGFRFATADNSSWFALATNPRHYLITELLTISYLYQACVPKPIILLCLYREQDVQNQATGDLSLEEIVFYLLQTHDRLLFLDRSGTLLFDKHGAEAMVRTLDLRQDVFPFETLLLKFERRITGRISPPLRPHYAQEAWAEVRTMSKYKSIQWKRSLGSYRTIELRALKFKSVKEFDRAIGLIWNDPDLIGVPNETPDGISLIVPEEAVSIFKAKGLQFKVSSVLSPSDLPPKKLAEMRRKYGM